jgi:hypothetical protein
MSSTEPRHEGHPPDSPSDVRPLPTRPNLEFERKQAKKLLALLRRENAEALGRVHARLKGTRGTKPAEYKLSDAQFTIAREYGFTSWPRLVEYFETLRRHEMTGPRERHTAEPPRKCSRPRSRSTRQNWPPRGWSAIRAGKS